MMYGQYGIDDVVLSMPAVVGKNGVETKVPISLNKEEQGGCLWKIEIISYWKH